MFSLAGSNTAVLTWTYQGNDASGFEIEEEDTSIAGTNFYTIQPNASVDSAGVGTAATYITPGDTYLFRIRADHTDGSVSAYVQSDPVTLTLADAPELSVKTITVDEGYGPFQEIEVGWSGIADIADATGISVDVMSSAIPGSGWSHVNDGDIENGSITFPIYAESPDPESGSGNTGFTIDPGVFGASTYTYRIQAFYSNGDVSAWSAPESAAIDGGPGPAPTLSTSGTTITASWAASDGPDALLMNQDGLPGNTLLGGGEILPIQQGQLNQAADTYTAVMGNLTPGTQYDFSLWTPVYEGNGQVLETFGDASITVGGTVPPVAPAAPSGAVAEWGVPNEAGVFLHWVDNSNNETGFWIYRSTGASFSSSNAVLVGELDADASTFDDANADPTQENNYDIFAVNAADTPTQPSTMPTSQPATTQVGAQPWYVSASVRKGIARGGRPFGEFQVRIDGPGPAPAVYQTVAISGTPVTIQDVLNEESDHNGANAFNGAIPDNPQGNANDVTPGLEQLPSDTPSQHNTATHWLFFDAPSFPLPPYAWNFAGTKSFVTTVKDPAGNVLKVINWHMTQTAGLRGLPNTIGFTISIDN